MQWRAGIVCAMCGSGGMVSTVCLSCTNILRNLTIVQKWFAQFEDRPGWVLTPGQHLPCEHKMFVLCFHFLVLFFKCKLSLASVPLNNVLFGLSALSFGLGALQNLHLSEAEAALP